MSGQELVFRAIFRVPANGLADFDAYEAAVQPLLTDHGGSLRQRLRTQDAPGALVTEVHIPHFALTAGFEAYRADPRRLAVSHLFATFGAEAEILSKRNVENP